MGRLISPAVVGILLLALAACGAAAPAAAPTATTAPQATAAPPAEAKEAAKSKESGPAAMAPSAGLEAYAAAHAGGPGAIYVGDINQLVGPAPTKVEGGFDGTVPLDSLQRHLYVFESDYYKSLLERAKLTNPTPLVSTGQNFEIQYACVNRSLLWCKLMDSFFIPNVLERTNGQLKLRTTSYPELGISGTDVLTLIEDSTLQMADVSGPFVAGDVPALELQYLFGLFPDQKTQFNATVEMYDDLVKLHEDETGGGKLINFFWLNGNDIFFFSKKPLRTADDFKGLKTRAFGTAIADWIEGMGADPQFVTFAEVYPALERGILDAGVTGGEAGYGQRWYEVTGYINGPLPAWPSLASVMNKEVWESLPLDLQQIMLEESAKTELENLRLGAIQNELGLQKNINEGMEYVEFSPELRARSNDAVLRNVAPRWVQRVGLDSPFIKGFNEKIGPRVGLHVAPDGSVSRVPITVTD